MFKKIINWILQSNRYKHLLYGILIGLLSNSWYATEYCAVFTAGALELKDKLYGGKPSWVDFIITVIGFNIGFAIRLLIMSILGNDIGVGP